MYLYAGASRQLSPWGRDCKKTTLRWRWVEGPLETPGSGGKEVLRPEKVRGGDQPFQAFCLNINHL